MQGCFLAKYLVWKEEALHQGQTVLQRSWCQKNQSCIDKEINLFGKGRYTLLIKNRDFIWFWRVLWFSKKLIRRGKVLWPIEYAFSVIYQESNLSIPYQQNKLDSDIKGQGIFILNKVSIGGTNVFWRSGETCLIKNRGFLNSKDTYLPLKTEITWTLKWRSQNIFHEGKGEVNRIFHQGNKFFRQSLTLVFTLSHQRIHIVIRGYFHSQQNLYQKRKLTACAVQWTHNRAYIHPAIPVFSTLARTRNLVTQRQ